MNWRRRKEIIQQADDDYYYEVMKQKEGLTTPPIEIEVKVETSIIETDTEKTFIVDSNVGGVELTVNKETKEVRKAGRPKKS